VAFEFAQGSPMTIEIRPAVPSDAAQILTFITPEFNT
jgi:hypothetical protein